MKNFKEMTLSQKRKLIALSGLPMVALMLMIGFQNCSPGVVSSTGTASTGGPGTGITPLDLANDTKPVTTTYSETLLVSMQQQLGIQTPSARTLTVARDAKTKVSESGSSDSLNAPMMIAVLNQGSELCLDLITAEKALAAGSRRFFGQIDFTQGPTAISSAAKDDMIRRMARNIWGRNETMAEKTVIRTAIDAAMASPAVTGQTAAQETENALLFTCSSMIASLDGIRQ